MDIVRMVTCTPIGAVIGSTRFYSQLPHLYPQLLSPLAYWGFRVLVITATCCSLKPKGPLKPALIIFVGHGGKEDFLCRLVGNGHGILSC